MIKGIDATLDYSKYRARMGRSAFVHCCPLNPGHSRNGAASWILKITARSFSIKNHENSPWNALDHRKIWGLSFIQLKLQLSPKPTLRRRVLRKFRVWRKEDYAFAASFKKERLHVAEALG